MKSINLLILSILLTIISCSSEKKKDISAEQLIRDYYHGFSSGDFTLVSKSVSDTLLWTEMDFVVSDDMQDLYRVFQWDSVFGAKFSILGCDKDSTGFTCYVAKTCKRIEFLQDSSIICQTRFEIKDKKISRMSTVEYTRFDNSLWEPRRDSLVAWIDKNHPELSGFVFDMSLAGAEKYLKAIELYEANLTSTNKD